MKTLNFLSIIIGMLYTSSLVSTEEKLNSTIGDSRQLTESQEILSKKNCRSIGAEGVQEKTEKRPDLCGNINREEDRCQFACIAGGFFQGICSSENECFCYRDNPEKGFIIERRQPVMRRVKTKNSNQKEITISTDDYTTGYVDVDVQLNLEWDLSYVNEWFQSFNFYKKMECDPCLCPAGCAIYGYFSGYCTPRPSSECMCATASRRPK